MRSNLVDLTLQRHAETNKAIFVSDDGEEKNAVWLPKSQIEIEPVKGKPEFVVVTMPGWLATEKELF